MWLQPLPVRFVRYAGQGGGRSSLIQKLVSVLKIDSASPVLLLHTVLHTDSAKAHQIIGPLCWPETGALHEEFKTAEPSLQHKYVHIYVG
jgi:hypothetical protein